ncbi:MAG: hypothetical protein ACOCXM_01445 [Myxococcota bacterium]
MKKAPLAQVKERFGSKDDLVKAVRTLASDDLWVDRLAEDDGLGLVSSRKLLHLHDVLSEVKNQFGTRGKLVDAVLELEKRAKDDGFRSQLERLPTPRLLDTYRSAKKRAEKAARKTAPAR